MIRYLAVSALCLVVGLTLVLSELRWFSRRPLVERLAPYLPGANTQVERAGLLSVTSFKEALGPTAALLGGALSRVFGVVEDLDRRLARVHRDEEATDLRVRQLAWSAAGCAVGLGATAVVRPPVVVALVFAVGGGVLAFLVIEQRVTAASDRWKEAVRRELPVVAEQLGMLLTAGFSLVAALERVAGRGRGAVAQDLARVLLRVRQGVSTERALREWADLAQVDAVDRLVSILALDREAGDLGRLIAAEARALRQDVQRDLVTTIERRGQQVWVPVTVAALLPGAIFIGIPFTAALRELLA